MIIYIYDDGHICQKTNKGSNSSNGNSSVTKAVVTVINQSHCCYNVGEIRNIFNRSSAAADRLLICMEKDDIIVMQRIIRKGEKN